MMKPQIHKGIISGEKIEEIRRTANIRDIVSEYVSLKKAGRSYVGLCPFHAEKTPSFHVREDKGSFKCFGCGAGGDVFRFYMMMTGVSFPEAVLNVAGRYGINVPQRPLSPRRKEEIDEKQRLFEINEQAARFFRNQLNGAAGARSRQYLRDRAMSASCIETFGLGYALPQWEGLVAHLKAKGLSLESALKAGLIRTGSRSDGYYDYFRDRIMFPIQDSQGRIIGFGGRILETGEPKYLNSPESPIYSKGSSLYGLFQARQAIQREGYTILVEGYFDLLSLHSHGISNGVAPLGTAVTLAQLQILKRYGRSMVVVFDGDDSGLKAMVRAIPLFLEEGIEARVVVLPGEQDPDDFLRNEGADAFRTLIEHAPAIMDFYLRWLMQQVDAGTVEGKRHVLQQMVPHLSAISDPISRSLYIEHVAQRLGVRSEQIVPLLKSVKERKNDSAGHPGPQGPAYDATEHLLMKLVFQHPEILPYVESTGVLDDLKEPELVRLMPWIQKCVEIEGVLNPDIIIQMVENERLQELVAQLAYFEKEGIINERKTVEDCILKIRRRNIQRELEKNRVFIQEAQERGDKEKVDALLLEQQDLIKRRKQLHALRQNLI